MVAGVEQESDSEIKNNFGPGPGSRFKILDPESENVIPATSGVLQTLSRFNAC